MSTSVEQTPGGIVVADEEVEGSRPRACWSVHGCDWRDELPEDVIELLAPPVIVSAQAFVPAVEPTVPAYDLRPPALAGDAEALPVLYGDAEALPVLYGDAEVPPMFAGDAGDAEVPVFDGDAEAPAAPDDAGPVSYRPRHAAPEEPPVTFTVPPRRLRRRRPAAA